MYLTKRQRELLDFINRYMERHDYAPTLNEIAEHLGLSSLATVHKHLSNLEKKGLIRRDWNRERSIELRRPESRGGGFEAPVLGRIAAGRPIEAVKDAETISLPESMLGRGNTYVLQVKGDSMVDEGILDGDYVIVESRESAENGEVVAALIGGEEATLKKYYREGGRVRLQPANREMSPIYVEESELKIQGVVIGLLRKFR